MSRSLMVAIAGVLSAAAVSEAAMIVQYDFEPNHVSGSAVTNLGTASGSNGTLVSGTSAVFSADARNGSGALTTGADGGLKGGNLNIGQFGTTITAWVKLNSVSSGGPRTIAATTRYDYVDGVLCWIDAGSGAIRIRTGQANGSKLTASTANGAYPLDGAYHHVAYVLDRTAGKAAIYVDGNAATMLADAIGTGYIYDTTSVTASSRYLYALYVGQAAIQTGVATDKKNFANSSIDDLELYDTALGADQIAGMVPEPAAVALLGLASGLLTVRRRRM